MGRRSASRRLNVLTAVEKRTERMDVAAWLLKPNQPATRIEVYTLLREFHYAEKRRRMSWLFKLVLAVWLVLIAPIRLSWRWAKKAWAKRARAEPEKREHDA